MWFQIFLQKDFQVNLVIIIFNKKNLLLTSLYDFMRLSEN